MAALQLGDITVQRIVEHEIPAYYPSDLFDEATAEAMESHRSWLMPGALCPCTGRLVMPVQSYLVQTGRHRILIDTCCGCNKTYAEPAEWHQRSNEAWLASLKAAGVSPEAVDYVICTHLHTDHCGWNTRLVDGCWVPTFPKAKYVIVRDEYRAAAAENSAYFIENVLPIVESGQVMLVDMDFELDEEISLEPAVGHSVGHVAVHIKSGDHHAVMCGDLIHTPLQLAELEWSLNSDYDLLVAANTRKNFLKKYCDTDTLILTSHFPSPSMGYIVSSGRVYDFVYVSSL